MAPKIPTFVITSGTRFLDDVNAAFAKLRNDPKAWKEEQAERALWDKTLDDGIETE